MQLLLQKIATSIYATKKSRNELCPDRGQWCSAGVGRKSEVMEDLEAVVSVKSLAVAAAAEHLQQKVCERHGCWGNMDTFRSCVAPKVSWKGKQEL